jgi:hypothetical protein
MEGNVCGPMSRIRLLVTYVCCCLMLSAAPNGIKNIRHEELSKDELVSIYEIPIQDEPAGKYVWEYDVPTYVRAVLEKREGKGDWKKIMLPTSNRPEKSSYVIIHLKRIKERIPDMKWGFFLNLRIGGSSEDKFGLMSSWIVSRALLNCPSLEYRSTFSPDPESLVLLTSGDVTYRLRLETSAQPFPGG